MEFWRFLDTDGLQVVSGTYDPVLVLASWLVASLAAYSALSVKDLVVAARERAQQRQWLVVGAIAMGLGIWSMHFTGMLAFSLPAPMSYRPLLTVASAVPAIVGSGFAIRVLAAESLGAGRLMLGGLLLAVAIGTMHFVGMEAMVADGLALAYDFWLFCGAIVAAFLLACAALWVRFVLARRGATTRSALFSAGIVGLAVANMHYIAMGSATFYSVDGAATAPGMQLPHELLAAMVILSTVVLLVFVIIAAVLDQRLLQSLENRERLVSVLPDAVVVVDAHYRIRSANPAAEVLFQYPEAELRRLRLEDLVPEWTPDRFKSTWGVGEVPATGRRADGHEVALEGKHVPQITKGEVFHVIVLRDCTERREREHAMRRLTAAVEQAQDGVLTTAPDGRIVYRNPAVRNLFGQAASGDDGVRDALQKLFALEAVAERVASGLPWHGTHRFSRCDGTEFRADIAVSPIKGEDGTTTELLTIVRDITEKDRLEAQLRNAQKLESIGQLASGIAHEINTPAQYVSDNVSFLREAWDDMKPLTEAVGAIVADDDGSVLAEPWEAADMEYLTAEVPDALEHCAKGLEQIKKIVLAMKKFAHPGEDQKEPSDVNELIENTAIIARNEWKYVAEMQFDFAEDLAEVPCVRSAVNQVFLNMIVNAAHAIEDKFGDGEVQGAIRVATRNGPDCVEIELTDNGNGMPEEVRQRIFDPFYTTKEVGRGSGQGLAIAHRVVVEGHGGTIDVSSRPGEGTTFLIRLPVGAAQEAVA